MPDSAHIEQVYNYADFDLFEVFDIIENQEEELEEARDAQQIEEERDNNFLPVPAGCRNWPEVYLQRAVRGEPPPEDPNAYDPDED